MLANPHGERRCLGHRRACRAGRLQARPDFELDLPWLLERNPYRCQPGLDAPHNWPGQDERPITQFHPRRLGDAQSARLLGKCTIACCPAAPGAGAPDALADRAYAAGTGIAGTMPCLSPQVAIWTRFSRPSLLSTW